MQLYMYHMYLARQHNQQILFSKIDMAIRKVVTKLICLIFIAQIHCSIIHVCPHQSWPSLQVDYKPQGQIISIGDTTVYHVGNSDKVLIMFSDIYGIYSGRHFSVADSYARLGLNVYVPQLLTSPFKGQGNIGQSSRNQKYQVMQQRFKDLVSHLNSQGHSQFFANGFCWGGWMAINLATKYDGFKAIASLHPSLRVSQLYNQTQADLVSNVKSPVYFYPAGNDPDNIKQEGQLVQILIDKFGENKVGSLTFPEQRHGWVTRGDITVPNILRDVRKAIEQSVKYFKKFD